jgi:hypothetical protein
MPEAAVFQLSTHSIHSFQISAGKCTGLLHTHNDYIGMPLLFQGEERRKLFKFEHFCQFVQFREKATFACRSGRF